MITFLPYRDFIQSAQSLDYRRLGKQRVEAFQTINTLIGDSEGFKNHPAVKMWRGYDQALVIYGIRMCQEWISRGYKDNLLRQFLAAQTPCIPEIPSWLGNEALHYSHRANLVRKDPLFYVPKFGELEWVPYVWPV